MAFEDSIAGDYVIFDGGQTVTLRTVRPDGATSVTIANATNGPLTRKQEAALAGTVSLNGDERSWSLNATQVGSNGVREGDKIIEANSATWTVIATNQLTLDVRWSCVSRKEET